jgi:hypothetical protein
VTSSQTLWGVRNRHGTVRESRSRLEAQRVISALNKAQNHTTDDLGGPWELVSGTIEWEAAE